MELPCRLAAGLAPYPSADGKTTTFAVSVPPLQPNESYRLRFELEQEPDPEKLKEVMAVARRRIDDRLAKVPPTDLTVAEIKNICDALREAVSSAVGPNHKIREGSALAKCPDVANETEASELLGFPPRLGRVLDAKGEGALARMDAAAPLSELARFLDTLGADKVYGRTAYELTRARDAEATSIAGRFAKALDLSFLESNQLERLARGADPGDPAARDLDAVETRADATHVAATYDALSTTLYSLEALLRTGALDRRAHDLKRSKVTVRPEQARSAAEAAEELAAAFRRIDRAYRDAETALDAVMPDVEAVIRSSIDVPAETFGDFATNSKLYVTADAGLFWAPDIDEVLPYLGANIYFRPINRDVPLRVLRKNGILEWRHRWSLTVGLVPQSIAKVGERADLFGGKSAVLGFGWRATDVIRLSAGALVFKELDPNPLINDQQLTSTPYVAISWDLDLAKTFAGFGSTYQK